MTIIDNIYELPFATRWIARQRCGAKCFDVSAASLPMATVRKCSATSHSNVSNCNRITLPAKSCTGLINKFDGRRLREDLIMSFPSSTFICFHRKFIRYTKLYTSDEKDVGMWLESGNISTEKKFRDGTFLQAKLYLQQ